MFTWFVAFDTVIDIAVAMPTHRHCVDYRCPYAHGYSYCSYRSCCCHVVTGAVVPVAVDAAAVDVVDSMSSELLSSSASVWPRLAIAGGLFSQFHSVAFAVFAVVLGDVVVIGIVRLI